MKRYLIFAVLGPLIGGFFLLLATTVNSGYWNEISLSEMTKVFGVFVKTLQYTYLFGIVPAVITGAVDDILSHIKRIGAAVRMVILGVLAFAATELVYGSMGNRNGAAPFILYGCVGLVPAMLSSWLAHRMLDNDGREV